MIAFGCPACDKQYNVPQEFAGKTTSCRACGERIVVPDALQEPEQQPVVWRDRQGGQPRKFLLGCFRLVDLVFDFRFKRYLTPYLVRALWALAILLSFAALAFNSLVLPLVGLASEREERVEREEPFLGRYLPESKPPTKAEKATAALLKWATGTFLRIVGTVVALMLLRILAEWAIVVFNISSDLKARAREKSG